MCGEVAVNASCAVPAVMTCSTSTLCVLLGLGFVALAVVACALAYVLSSEVTPRYPRKRFD